MSMHGQHESMLTSWPQSEDIRIYGSVTPRKPAPTIIDCRTCVRVGLGGCTLVDGECSSGSAYVAAPVLRFWRQS